MSVRDSLRAIGTGGVLVLLLLPGFVAVVPVVAAIVLAILAFAHGLALAKTVVPAFGVLLVLEITRNVLAKFPGDCPGSLPATAATVIETIGERRWITLGDQILVGRLATRDQHQQSQHTCATPHLRLPCRWTAYG